jgi:ATP synthase protein I
VIEMVAGLLIGFGVGYGLDRMLGTLPWFLVLLTFAGFAAGVKTMLRSAREIENKRAMQAADLPRMPDDKEDD